MPALNKKVQGPSAAPLIGFAQKKRLLKRLAGGPLPLSAVTATNSENAIQSSPRAADRAARPVAIDALLKADLAVLGEDGALRLSAAGRAWLKRAIAVGDGFQEQHGDHAARLIPDESGAVLPVTVNLKESPLAWLHFRKGRDGKALIDESQFEAGERLRRDYEFGQIRPGMATQSWSPVAGARGDGIGDLSDAVMDARARVEGALAAVGPELSGVLVDVCCYLKGLELVESERRWPARSAKLVLGLSLDRLARHYGLAK